MGIRYRYNIGLKKYIDLDATAINSESNEISNYHLTSNGNYHSFMLSASYRISRIWNRKQLAGRKQFQAIRKENKKNSYAKSKEEKTHFDIVSKRMFKQKKRL